MLAHLKMALHHILCNNCTVHQSVTYRYRDFFIFLVVSEPVSEEIGTGKSLGSGIGKFGSGKKSRNRYRKYLVPEMIFIAKILEFRRFVMGTGTVQVPVLVVSEQVPEKISEPVSVKFGIGKTGLGTGIGKIWDRKKVSVLEKFGTGKKKYQYRYRLTF